MRTATTSRASVYPKWRRRWAPIRAGTSPFRNCPSSRYLAGLVGAFEPFPLTKEQREQSGDARLSVAERYTGRQDYLDRVKRAADDLVRQRFMLGPDVPAVVQRAEQIWNAVVSGGTR